jgi:biotin synthase
VDRIVEAARDAAARGAHRFGIVTSGRGVHEEREVETIARAVEIVAGSLPLEPCVSLGLVEGEFLHRLRDAGLTRYHHNLETAESFFPNICTTRRYEDSVETVRAAREVGLKTCSGGIFGLGESKAQRVELLEALRQLDVDSVPLNFLNPIPGTRLEGRKTLEPLEGLKIIAVARLMMPDKEIRVCGGREVTLRDLQSWALLAGADGLMVGGYLTTAGRGVDEDLRMIADAGFEVREAV